MGELLFLHETVVSMACTIFRFLGNVILCELVQQKQETHRVYRFSIIADKQAASSSDNSRADLGGSAVAKLLSANGRYDLHMGQLKYSRSAGALYFIEHA